MRVALQRLLASQSALCILRKAVQSGGASFFQHHSPSGPTGQARGYAAEEQGEAQPAESGTRGFQIPKLPLAVKADKASQKAIGPTRSSTAQRVDGLEGNQISLSTVRPDLKIAPVTRHDLHSDIFSSRTHSPLGTKTERNDGSWRKHLVTSEQYEYESDIGTPASQGLRLVDDPSHAQDWDLWLELIVFRKKHHGVQSTTTLYNEILRRRLPLPTQGAVANQLWDILIQAGYYGSRLLQEIVTYAIRLKRLTGRSWPGMYYGIVSVALRKNSISAFGWHLKLKEDFPPSLEDYKNLFKNSLDWGCSAHLRSLYKDTPLVGMYEIVIWHSCKLQMYRQALKWHDVLCDAKDYPATFADIRPLLEHLAYVGNGPRIEGIVRALAEAKVGDSNVGEDFILKDATMSREILNRRLGEAHGVGPKHLSDAFCARLFATRLFSVDTVIGGLQTMGMELIGPLSLREIAIRDNSDPSAIQNHIDTLKTAGISLETSVFCTLVRSLAVENKREMLETIVNCDLHPDAFADFNLQDRLLAQYYEEKDLTKISRTLTILTTGCSAKKAQMLRMNAILRCQITLGKLDQVLATLEELKRMDIRLTDRSSKHLRVCWLSRRQRGRGPSGTRELAILVKASQMSMESGFFVPIISWREILRRLGMNGLLTEFENLALWLVDWYSSPAAKAAISKGVLLSPRSDQALIGSSVPPKEHSHSDPQRLLSVLFTNSAQHAIIAWGFQHMRRSQTNRKRPDNASPVEDRPPFQWEWGLHLLYKLRERGVLIEREQVARICRHRLDILFGPGSSKLRINRAARSEQRESYSESVYIRKMEAIWGKDLFQKGYPVGRKSKQGSGKTS